VTLRAGTNGFTCFPDDPHTPAPDPICADKAWGQWFEACMANKQPMLKQVGIAYMLRGSSDASNTDPFAMKPAAGQSWVVTPAHTMVIVPDPKQLDAYPSDPKSGGPFVMFKGTPYAHLMVPAHYTPKRTVVFNDMGGSRCGPPIALRCPDRRRYFARRLGHTISR